MGILVNLLVLVIVIVLVFYVLNLMGLPAPAMQIVRIILGLIFLIVLLGFLFGPSAGWNFGSGRHLMR